MAMRQLVTGADACGPSDGSDAGPANAAAALANQLLGMGNDKTQERLHQLPQSNLPSITPSAQGPVHAPSVADAVSAVLDEGGLGRQFESAWGRPPGPSSLADEFWQQQQQQGQQRLGLLPPPPQHLQPGFVAPPVASTQGASNQIAQPFLQAFMESGKAGMDFQPLRSIQGRMPVEDQCRVRDRATIMSRHIFAAHGEAFADAQVAKLLGSLNIDPAALPANWEEVYRAGGAGPAADLAAAGQMAAAQRPAAGWASEFQRMRLDEQPAAQQSNGWQAEFLQQQQQQQQRPPLPSASAAPSGWAQEFEQQQAGAAADWSTEFSTQQNAASLANGATMATRLNGDMLQHTRALEATMASNSDPKFKNSKFLQFLSKMSNGEVILEDNQVKEVPPEHRAAQWAEEFDAQPGGDWASDFHTAEQRHSGVGAQSWAAQFGDAHQQQQRQRQQQRPSEQSWASEFTQHTERPPAFAAPAARGVSTAEADAMAAASQQDWAAEFGQDRLAEGVDRWADTFASDMAGDVENWAEQFRGDQWASEFARAAGTAAGVSGPRTRQEGYQFAADNPYTDDADSFAKGRELFRRGVLSEAILALEAEVRRSPGHTAAWRLLGTAHAENEDDVQAIAAMDAALRADSGDLEVLLALGVSHTNEMEASEALGYLQRWLGRHPAHGPAAAAPAPPDASQRHLHVVRQFEAAAAAAPADADLQVALGVLHNLSRDFGRAEGAFRAALALRPADYSLWNKLGATMANGSRSAEAVAAYRKALELKPNYMRAWANMGISQANLGAYDASARFYIRALGLNPGAEAVWGYLRTSLSCSGRLDLMPLVDGEDLEGLQRQLPLQ